MSDKKDKKDKEPKGKKSKGFFGKMFGGKDDEPADAPAPPVPVTPSSVQARLAAGPAENVLAALRANDTPALRQALLSFGSATPALSKAVAKLKLDKGELFVGKWSLAEILSRAEGSHRPRPVREVMGVDRDAWEATACLATVLVQVLGAVGKS